MENNSGFPKPADVKSKLNSRNLDVLSVQEKIKTLRDEVKSLTEKDQNISKGEGFRDKTVDDGKTIELEILKKENEIRSLEREVEIIPKKKSIEVLKEEIRALEKEYKDRITGVSGFRDADLEKDPIEEKILEKEAQIRKLEGEIGGADKKIKVSNNVEASGQENSPKVSTETSDEENVSDAGLKIEVKDSSKTEEIDRMTEIGTEGQDVIEDSENMPKEENVERLTEIGTEGREVIVDSENLPKEEKIERLTEIGTEGREVTEDSEYIRKEKELDREGELKLALENARNNFARTDFRDRGVMERLRKALNTHPKEGQEETPNIVSAREAYQKALGEYKDFQMERLRNGNLESEQLESELKRMITFSNCDEVFAFADARQNAKMEYLEEKEGKGFWKRGWDTVRLKAAQVANWYDKDVHWSAKMGLALASFLPGAFAIKMGKRALGAAMMGAAGGMKIDKLAQIKDRVANKIETMEVMNEVRSGEKGERQFDLERFNQLMDDRIKDVDMKLSRYVTRSQINKGIAGISAIILGGGTAMTIMDYANDQVATGKGILGALFAKQMSEGVNVETPYTDAFEAKVSATEIPKASEIEISKPSVSHFETVDSDSTEVSVEEKPIPAPAPENVQSPASVEQASVVTHEELLDKKDTLNRLEELEKANPGKVDSELLDNTRNEIARLDAEYARQADKIPAGGETAGPDEYAKLGSIDHERDLYRQDLMERTDFSGQLKDEVREMRQGLSGGNVQIWNDIKDRDVQSVFAYDDPAVVKSLEDFSKLYAEGDAENGIVGIGRNGVMPRDGETIEKWTFRVSRTSLERSLGIKHE